MVCRRDLATAIRSPGAGQAVSLRDLRGFIFLRDLRAKFFWQARARHDRSRGYAGPYAGRAPARKLSGVGRSALELRGMAVPLAKSGISA